MLPEFVQNPDSHLFDIARIYLLLKNDAQMIKPMLDQLSKIVPVSFSTKHVGRHSQVQAAYSIVSALAVLLNSLLRVFDPFNPILTDETTYFCDEVIIQAELASCYRPIGSAYIPLCLIVVWAATDDIFQLAKIESLLADYQSDFAEVPWRCHAVWLGSTLNDHRMRIMSGKQSNGVATTPQDPNNVEEKGLAQSQSCCIL